MPTGGAATTAKGSTDAGCGEPTARRMTAAPSRARHALAIVVSAAACGVFCLTVAPWHWLAWVMLVPWLVALDGTTTWGGVLGSGIAMAVAYCVAIFSWFPVAMADYAGAPVWIAAAIGLVAAPLFQPQIVCFALGRHGARRLGLGSVGIAVVGAASWIGCEAAVPKLLGDTIGAGFYPSLWQRQAADLAGLPGLTFVLLLGNECVRASWVAARARRAASTVVMPLAVAGALVLALTLYGLVRLANVGARIPEVPVAVGVVQADLAHYDRLRAEVGTYEAVRRIVETHLAMSDEIRTRANVDVLVWPETVYPTTFGSPKSEEGAAFDRAIAGLVVASGRPLVFGSYDADGDREYNAAVFLEPDGTGGVTFETYRKASLFPLTERVPAWLDGPRLRAWMPWLGSWQPGGGDNLREITLGGGRRLRVAPLICYDAVYPEHAIRAVRAGAELIVTLSNDSWLADGEGARLHFVISAFRSIETRRPQVRATTTGISAIIGPDGTVLARAGIHERAGLTGSVVPVRDLTTLAVGWGNWLPPTAFVVACALLAIGRGRAASGN